MLEVCAVIVMPLLYLFFVAGAYCKIFNCSKFSSFLASLAFLALNFLSYIVLLIAFKDSPFRKNYTLIHNDALITYANAFDMILWVISALVCSLFINVIMFFLSRVDRCSSFKKKNFSNFAGLVLSLSFLYSAGFTWVGVLDNLDACDLVGLYDLNSNSMQQKAECQNNPSRYIFEHREFFKQHWVM